jgi:hypothetical protein
MPVITSRLAAFSSAHAIPSIPLCRKRLLHQRPALLQERFCAEEGRCMLPAFLSTLSIYPSGCRMYTYAVPCCFKAPVRKEGQRIVTRFQLQDDIEEEICSNDPWIILHKIDSPTKMRYIGSKVASCNQTLDSTAVAPSIAAWVKQKGAPKSALPLLLAP